MVVDYGYIFAKGSLRGQRRVDASPRYIKLQSPYSPQESGQSPYEFVTSADSQFLNRVRLTLQKSGAQPRVRLIYAQRENSQGTTIVQGCRK